MLIHPSAHHVIIPWEIFLLLLLSHHRENEDATVIYDLALCPEEEVCGAYKRIGTLFILVGLSVLYSLLFNEQVGISSELTLTRILKLVRDDGCF